MHMALLASLSPFLQTTFTNPSHTTFHTATGGWGVFSHAQLMQHNMNVANIHIPLSVSAEISKCLGQTADLSSIFSLSLVSF